MTYKRKVRKKVIKILTPGKQKEKTWLLESAKNCENVANTPPTSLCHESVVYFLNKANEYRTLAYRVK